MLTSPEHRCTLVLQAGCAGDGGEDVSFGIMLVAVAPAADATDIFSSVDAYMFLDEGNVPP